MQTHNPTICTMKIFILFALVSISVCRDNDNYESPPVNCVAYGSSSGQGQNSQSSGQGKNSQSSGQGSGSFSSSSSSFSSSSSSSSSSFSSSSYEYTKCDSPYNNQDVGKATCLKIALQNVPALAQGANRLLCHLKNDQNNQDTENYNNVTRELRAIVRCAGCKLDDVLGTGETLENTGDGVGDLLGKILELLGGVLGDLGLADTIGDLMCNLENLPESAANMLDPPLNNVMDAVEDLPPVRLIIYSVDKIKECLQENCVKTVQKVSATLLCKRLY